MGMYTELVMGFSFNKFEHEDLYELLRCMFSGSPHVELINRRRMIFNGASAYFPFQSSHSIMSTCEYSPKIVNISIRSSIKNYDNDYEWFINKIQTILNTHEFLGYYIYEEDEYPTLIYGHRIINLEAIHRANEF